MLVRHFMVRYAAATSTVLNTAPLSEALARMIKHHLQQLIVVDDEGNYVGEITSFTLAKLLLPNGSQSPQEAEWETVGDVDQRIQPHLGQRVADFVDTDSPGHEPGHAAGRGPVAACRRSCCACPSSIRPPTSCAVSSPHSLSCAATSSETAAHARRIASRGRSRASTPVKR